MQVANKLGETIYKGHRSYDLMLNLQLGIRHSSQQVAKEPPLKQLSEEHFQQKVCCAMHNQLHITPCTCGISTKGHCDCQLMHCIVNCWHILRMPNFKMWEEHH